MNFFLKQLLVKLARQTRVHVRDLLTSWLICTWYHPSIFLKDCSKSIIFTFGSIKCLNNQRKMISQIASKSLDPTPKGSHLDARHHVLYTDRDLMQYYR